jgi:hypothetical protein
MEEEGIVRHAAGEAARVVVIGDHGVLLPLRRLILLAPQLRSGRRESAQLRSQNSEGTVI